MLTMDSRWCADERLEAADLDGAATWRAIIWTVDHRRLEREDLDGDFNVAAAWCFRKT